MNAPKSEMRPFVAPLLGLDLQLPWNIIRVMGCGLRVPYAGAWAGRSVDGWFFGLMSGLRAATLLVALGSFCFCLSRSVAAGFSIPTNEDYLIRSWETADGLPENSATSIAQTPDGYLWFGTFNGLVRFNGVE